MNIQIAKAFRTKCSEALCNSAGTTQIIIKAEEAAKLYEVCKGHRANMQKIGREFGLKQWPHSTDFINFPETNGCDDQTIRIYRDGNNCERGLRAGVVIFVNNEWRGPHKFRLNNRW